MDRKEPEPARKHFVARVARVALVAVVFVAACDQEDKVPFGVDTVDSADGSVALGDVVILSQADIAKLDGIRHIEGDLVIRMTTAVSLPGIVTIGGSLRVDGSAATEVASDVALPALTRIGNDLAVAYTKDSGRLRFPLLTEVGGHVALTHGTWDVDLRALATIGADLRVNDASLVRVNLGVLESVGGSLRMLRYSSVSGGALTITLPKLASIVGDLELAQGADLVLEAPKLENIGRDLDIADLTAGLSLAGLETIGDDLDFDNVNMTALDLSGLTTVKGNIRMDGARGEGLVDLTFESLETIAGDLDLRAVSSLTVVNLPVLVDLGGHLVFDRDPALSRVDLQALGTTRSDIIVREASNVLLIAQALTEIGGELRITDCSRIQLSLPALTAIVRSLIIRGGTLVTPGVPKLASVGGDVVFEGLSVELDTLSLDLASVGGTLRVASTIYLNHLVLDSLTHVGSVQGGFPTGDLVLRENFTLADVSFAALIRIERDIVVSDNPRLSTAAVTALLDAITSTGTRTVCGNDGGEACPE